MSAVESDEDAKTLKLLEDTIRRVVREELERAQVPCIWCRKNVRVPTIAQSIDGSTAMLYPPAG